MALSDNPTWIALTRGTIEARSRSYAPARIEAVTREYATVLLTAAVQDAIANGAKVEYATDATAVLTYGSRPNHVLHLLLSVLTFGLWLVVWAAAAAANQSRVMLTTDPCGNVTRTEAG